MNPRQTRLLPPATEPQLEEFLRKSASSLSVTEALVAAAKLRIEREKRTLSHRVATNGKFYFYRRESAYACKMNSKISID